MERRATIHGPAHDTTLAAAMKRQQQSGSRLTWGECYRRTFEPCMQRKQRVPVNDAKHDYYLRRHVFRAAECDGATQNVERSPTDSATARRGPLEFPLSTGPLKLLLQSVQCERMMRVRFYGVFLSHFAVFLS